MHQRFLKNALYFAIGTLGVVDLSFSQEYCSPRQKWGTPGIDCQKGFDGATEGRIKERCWQEGEDFAPQDSQKDHLYPEPGTTRLNWAVSCQYVSTDPRTLQLFKEQYDAFAKEWYPRERVAFPTFAHNDSTNFLIWKPEVSAAGYPATPASCVKPSTVDWIAICEAGCYERSMQILFSDGYKTIETAIEELKTNNVQHFIKTLSNDSTFDNLIYQDTPVSSFTREPAESEQEIFKFVTESGGAIKVTNNHPLVTGNGAIRLASSLKVGDSLVKDSGETDKIVEISINRIKTKTFNLAPAGLSPLNNVLVAEGFLNGSQRYQDQQIKDLNRLAVRSSIPVGLY